jgi:hypothetical protein
MMARARLKYDGIIPDDSWNKLLRIESIIATKITASTALFAQQGNGSCHFEE